MSLEERASSNRSDDRSFDINSANSYLQRLQVRCSRISDALSSNAVDASASTPVPNLLHAIALVYKFLTRCTLAWAQVLARHTSECRAFFAQLVPESFHAITLTASLRASL
jgi:hypothetical protein